MKRTLWMGLGLVVLVAAADVAGRWTATFDTQIGKQDYTYEFAVNGKVLTGKAISDFGEVAIQEGKVWGDSLSFVEMLDFQGQPLRIVYRGRVAGDEIRFTRTVGTMATEQLVAKRAKAR